MAERHWHPCGHECGCSRPEERICVAEAVALADSVEARAAILAARWPGERGLVMHELAERLGADER